MFNQKGNLSVVLVIAVLLIAIAGGFYYISIQKNQSSALPPAYSIPTLKPILEEQSSENAQVGFKVYSATKFSAKYGSSYNFSILYPEDWIPRDHDYGTGANIAFLSPDYETAGKGAGEEVLNGGRIEISVLPNQNITTLEDWVKSFYSNPQTNKTFVTPQAKIVGNKQIQEFDYNDGDSGKIDMISTNAAHTTVFAVGNTVYSFHAVSKVKSAEYLAVVEKIIESFKLTQ